jgi:predicted Zn-dependent peptidase
VERGAAASEEDTGARREPAVSDALGYLPQPRGLCGDRGSCQVSRHEGVYTIASVPVFEQSRLDNGIRVLTADMPQVNSVACFVMLAAGSRYETPGSKGIAHFAEHMFFKGTERRPTARTISAEIDAIGGEFNAFTSKEITGYYVKCGAETRDVALDVLVDMLLHSRFDADEIAKEKGVILEEMNVYLDTPARYIGSVYDRLLFGDQPLGWDILGTRETVEAATRDTFISYLDAWYRPERIVVGIAGRTGEDLHPRLEELLGGVEPRETGTPAPVELPTNGSPVLLHTKQSEQAHLHLGVRGYELGHPDRYALQLLAVVLGGGMSSRLFTEVRERRGLAYYVHAANGSFTDAGTLYTGAGVDVGRIDEAIKTIVAELRKVAAEPLPADELEKARGYSKGRFVLRLESPQGLIQFGLRRELLEHRIEEPDDVLRHLDQVTAKDVQRVATDLLSERPFYLAVVGPFDDPARFEQLLAA